MSVAITLSLTAIRVSDLARSVAFYTRGCGFVMEREFTTPSFTAAIVRAGSAGLELILPAETASAVADHGSMLRKFVLNTDDPAAVMSRACALGGTEITAATDHPEYGMTIGVITDPDGYELEFVGRLDAPGCIAGHEQGVHQR
ncbi:VOC family protein [Gordonia sp. zg691]|uniref:VOC family protein n=1 Tax=Gordonia jinghuaiqii TaxID=2758710 RepID=UPI001662259C|nr:VOC family protein [Gordonia jinghuaiqii]MBD0861747.1 VOC family protein [Gordonia jinghuaiqii]